MAETRVVVLGAGFAGLRAVRRLGRAGVPTLWVDARNYHCFLPLLYQVATAGLEPQDIAYPARSILHRYPSVDFRLACVVRGDPRARLLETATGDRIGYDYLIVATGGAGATGVEMAGALAEFRLHVIPRDYRTIDPASLRIVVVEAGPEVLPPYPPDLRSRARQDLLRFGVELRTGAKVSRIGTDAVELAGGERIATETVIWAAGIRAAPVAGALTLPTGRSGRIRVEPTLAVVGQPGVFAVGDVALVEGAERLPQVAQVAMQQGEHAADNVVRAMKGEPLLPFAYKDKGSMATIGRSRAVCVIGRVHLKGHLAWWMWLVVHLVMLIGFRNRLVVLVNWTWNYLTYDRGLRAIIGSGTECVEEDRRAAGGSG